MPINDQQALLPINLIVEVMEQVAHDPRAMVAVIGMFTNNFAADVAAAIALDDEATKDRCELIHQQIQDHYERGEFERPSWIEDLTLFAREDAEALFGRAVKRHLNVYLGKHKPFSATRGKGFGS